MDGNIEVYSELGKGTEFVVSIPMELSAEVTTFVEEVDNGDQFSEIVNSDYEFCICDNQTSFGI